MTHGSRARGLLSAVGVAALVLGLSAAGNATGHAGSSPGHGREGGRAAPAASPGRRVSGTAPTAFP